MKENIKPLLYTQDLILVKHIKKGNCIIAGKDFHKDDIILESPVILFPVNKHSKKIDNMVRYCYYWDEEKKYYAITTSISVYINHSSNPNTGIHRDTENLFEILFASVDIKKGEELTIDYLKLDFNEKLGFKEIESIFYNI